MNFQITLLNYKLDFQNKNMGFFKLKKIFITHSTVDFQITLSTYKLNSFFKKKNTYKLDSQNKNTRFYFFLLKNRVILL